MSRMMSEAFLTIKFDMPVRFKFFILRENPCSTYFSTIIINYLGFNIDIKPELPGDKNSFNQYTSPPLHIQKGYQK